MPFDDKPKSASKGSVNHTSSGLGDAIPFGPVTNNLVYHQKFEDTYNRGQQLKAYEALFDNLTDDKAKNKKRVIKLAEKYRFIDEFEFINASPTAAKFLAIEEMRLLIGALRQTTRYTGKKDDVTTFKGIKMRGADLGVFAQGILDKHEIEFAKRHIALLEEMKAKQTDPTEIDKYNQAIKNIQATIDVLKLDIKSRQQKNTETTNTETTNTATEENPSEA